MLPLVITTLVLYVPATRGVPDDGFDGIGVTDTVPGVVPFSGLTTSHATGGLAKAALNPIFPLLEVTLNCRGDGLDVPTCQRKGGGVAGSRSASPECSPNPMWWCFERQCSRCKFPPRGRWDSR